MKYKDIQKHKGQQEALYTILNWGAELTDYETVAELLESTFAEQLLYDYIDSIDITKKLSVVGKLIAFFKRQATINARVQEQYNAYRYEKRTNPVAYSHALKSLSSTDVIQPDILNKLICEQFITPVKSTDVILFPCCGRGNDLLYICKTYNVPKDNCICIELDSRLCQRLRNMGFRNVIEGDIFAESTWKTLYNILERMQKENPMTDITLNKVPMNPPFGGSLHLDVLETVHTKVTAINPNAEIVSIQPVRWLEDPLAEYKQGSDYKKYKHTIASKISKLQLIRASDATSLFTIDTGSDLGIYTFNNTTASSLQITNVDIKSIINKVIKKSSRFLADMIDAGKVDGWRCEIKEMLPEGGSHSAGDCTYSRTCGVKVVLGPYNNGIDSNGKFFSEARAKNGREKGYFRFSILFNDEATATNFAKSHTTNFFNNLIQIMKYDQHAPLRFLPYLEDYSKVWTDEDYCKFFDLTEEESEFMCRTVDDYRVKDFINYINLDEE